MIPSSSLPSKHKKARVQPYSLKVTYAFLEEGKIKNPTRQIFVLINDETANVNHIKKQCEEELKINNIVLTAANGLLIEDSAGTSGLCTSLLYNATSVDVKNSSLAYGLPCFTCSYQFLKEPQKVNRTLH